MDDREASLNADLADQLKSRLPDGEFVVDRLKLGDYLIMREEHPVLIERMTENEVLDQRKMQQVEGMVKENPEMDSLVLFEGVLDHIFYWRKINPNAVYGKLWAILGGWRVPILWCENQTKTVEWLYQIHRSVTKPEGEQVPYVRPSARKGASFEEQQLYVLTSIRGIGWSLAKTLLQEKGNARNVFNCSKEELMQIKGIGEGKAGKIVSIATGQKLE